MRLLCSQFSHVMAHGDKDSRRQRAGGQHEEEKSDNAEVKNKVSSFEKVLGL